MEGVRQNAFMEAMVAVVHPSVMEATPTGFAGADPQAGLTPQREMHFAKQIVVNEPPAVSPGSPKRTYNGVRSSRLTKTGLPGEPDSQQSEHAKKQTGPMTLYMVLGGIFSFVVCMGTFLCFQNAKGHMYDSNLFSAKLAKAQEALGTGQYQDAVDNATQAVDEASKLGNSDPQLGNALFVRAKANYALGKNDLSKADAQKALTIRRAISGERSWPTAEAMVALAKTYITESNFKDAEPLLMQAVSAENTFQGKELDRADSVYTLGVCHEHLAMPKEAANEVGQALAIEQKILKANDPTLAATQTTYDRLNAQASSQTPVRQNEVSAAEEIMPPVTETQKPIGHSHASHHASRPSGSAPMAPHRRAYNFGY
jgi:tetratricopeptide (TPR) repeat protein